MVDHVRTMEEMFQNVVSRICHQQTGQRHRWRRWAQGIGEVIFAVCLSSK